MKVDLDQLEICIKKLSDLIEEVRRARQLEKEILDIDKHDPYADYMDAMQEAIFRWMK